MSVHLDMLRASLLMKIIYPIVKLISFLFSRRFKVDEFDYSAVCSKMAKICEGMSGREISKMGVSWQAAVYASEEGVLTEKMVFERCHTAVHQHKQKVVFICF